MSNTVAGNEDTYINAHNPVSRWNSKTIIAAMIIVNSNVNRIINNDSHTVILPHTICCGRTKYVTEKIDNGDRYLLQFYKTFANMICMGYLNYNVCKGLCPLFFQFAY